MGGSNNSGMKKHEKMHISTKITTDPVVGFPLVDIGAWKKTQPTQQQGYLA
jgi:hypothetical protein